MSQKNTELEDALALFMGNFEHVFETDWEHTKACLRSPDVFIDSKENFLSPGMFDEATDWCSRAVLLGYYRDLVEAMYKRGIIPVLDDEELNHVKNSRKD